MVGSCRNTVWITHSYNFLLDNMRLEWPFPISFRTRNITRLPNSKRIITIKTKFKTYSLTSEISLKIFAVILDKLLFWRFLKGKWHFAKLKSITVCICCHLITNVKFAHPYNNIVLPLLYKIVSNRKKRAQKLSKL